MEVNFCLPSVKCSVTVFVYNALRGVELRNVLEFLSSLLSSDVKL
jgi:hypothetical protein